MFWSQVGNKQTMSYSSPVPTPTAMSTTTTTTATSSEFTAELIPSLPYDVASNCLARIPRHYHPILSILSKPIRSLLSSPFFFTTRSLLNSAQHLLYLTLRSPDHRATWFALYQNPNPRNDAVRLLVPIPPVPVLAVGAAYAVVGPEIYVLGGSVNDAPSNNVWVLDCRFHTWRAGPPMRVAREFAAAGVVDGRIYVIGGCVTDSWTRSEYWAEALDPGSGVWEAVPSPVEVRGKWMHASAVIGGRVYALADRGGVVYDPRTRVWEGVEKRMDMGWRGRACVVHGMLYCYDYLGKIRGFDAKNRMWKELKGVEKKLPKFLCGATMANVGENLVVLWETKGNGKDMEIWCAEIEVKENGDGELWGRIDWSQKLLSVPKHSNIVQCSAVDV
ncbi:F-box/kelch-repeat protein SKIP6 [Rosa rugosa]|uniref:F-box/kelch-repeat protein SKIP6 n=1 Tax=Rosa rugosa TaxID=74645 RepID=UPI002B4174D1|nr:F-box/kelch-repeat protein SKIP6 [Rosa rugosa]XP_062007112.1 F-box/kelch-repeat protein SKIP6 [Rosa rugosa]